jgi:hypothetical protein
MAQQTPEPLDYETPRERELRRKGRGNRAVAGAMLLAEPHGRALLELHQRAIMGILVGLFGLVVCIVGLVSD